MLRFIFDCFVCFIASLEYHRHRNDLKWMVILNNVYTRPPHASCSHQGSHQADLSRFEQNPTSHHVSCPLYRILLPTYNIQHGYKNTFNFNHGQDKVSVLCSFIFNTQLFCFFFVGVIGSISFHTCKAFSKILVHGNKLRDSRNKVIQ